MQRSLVRQTGAGLIAFGLITRHEFALALLCALVVVLFSSATAAAEPPSRPMPPETGPWLIRHIEAGARDGPDAKSNRPARDTSDQNRDQPEQRAPTITPAQAAQRAREHFGGRILNVMLEHGQAGPYYRVKLLKQGRVRVVDIDACH